MSQSSTREKIPRKFIVKIFFLVWRKNVVTSHQEHRSSSTMSKVKVGLGAEYMSTPASATNSQHAAQPKGVASAKKVDKITRDPKTGKG